MVLDKWDGDIWIDTHASLEFSDCPESSGLQKHSLPPTIHPLIEDMAQVQDSTHLRIHPHLLSTTPVATIKSRLVEEHWIY
jgi:hypothetical protein